jgi:flagellar hook protein FlgE
MAINSVTGSALLGIQRGMQGLRRNAAEIASAQHMNPGIPNKDLTRSLVELHQNELYTTVNIKTLKTADQVIGTLLDVKA